MTDAQESVVQDAGWIGDSGCGRRDWIHGQGSTFQDPTMRVGFRTRDSGVVSPLNIYMASCSHAA